MNVNCNVETGSKHSSQVPQVLGQAAATPFTAHRIFVFFLAAQEQDLESTTPPCGNLNLRSESTQLMVGIPVGKKVENAEG